MGAIHTPNPILRFVRKFKPLKHMIRHWNLVVFWDLFAELEAATVALDEIQQEISVQGDSDQLFNEEMHHTSIVNWLFVQRHALLTQRGRLQQLEDVDRNFAFFHKFHSARCTRASISTIQVGDTFITVGEEIGQHMVSFYETLFIVDTTLNSDFSILDVID